MDKFGEVYATLNPEQKLAVDTIDGPLLVIAGPGTGKTQLLGARVANILTKTDTPARNILCLTFTDNAADNMRQRLSSFIGQAAYDVTISTYHAFGGDLIKRFPEYFKETRLQNVIDELGRRQIIAELVEDMNYNNPLKQTQHHIGDLISTISEVKRALLTSKDLRQIAAENINFCNQADAEIKDIMGGFTGMRGLTTVVPLFEQLGKILIKFSPTKPVNKQFGSLAQVSISSLQTALSQAVEIGKTAPLTNWKDDWLVKDANNQFILNGEIASKRIEALADILDKYQSTLNQRGLYDYDDMIIRAIEVLSANDDLRFTLQEQYLYILLDELQDTNPSQLKLVELLSDNPVHEGRPNVMAVGDDDQAIYAFQGAQYSNMLDFFNLYRTTAVINLTENYRSHADILLTAQNIADQIETRLHNSFEGVVKTLRVAGQKLPTRAIIERNEFLSNIAQENWIAQRIKQLIDSGTKPKEIAILAPQHRQLEPIVPYLTKLNIPVRYEKRENILETPVVKQLLNMSRLVLALQAGDEATANHLWPEVLSYSLWKLPISSIWQMSWQVADERHSAKESKKTSSSSWSRALLSSGQQFRLPALLFLSLAGMVEQETCEAMLDYLIGTDAVKTQESDLPQVFSPFRQFYTSPEMIARDPELFYETLSHLTVLRTKLRKHQDTYEKALTLHDLISFVDMYAAADERMINTSPYNQKADAVQIMTVFKAKGLEFEHVFLPSCQDNVWGSTAREQGNKLTLPANLKPIRKAGATDDERLRILFVAITRSKFGLYLASVAQNYDGKPNPHLKYFDERGQDNGTVKDLVLPKKIQTVKSDDKVAPSASELELDWRPRHLVLEQGAELKSLLENRLINYQLSPTHLNTFLDLEYGGPERFFFNSILRFPEAPIPDGEFGNAIHETLEWLQHQVSEKGSLPPAKEVISYFTARMQSKKLTPRRLEIEVERGVAALKAYLKQRSKMFMPGDRAEMSFKNEGVFVGEAHLAGKIDRLEIDKKNKTITVVDYKTGTSHDRWLSSLTLLRYRRQLYCYKLLVEKSSSFAGYKVLRGRLEFIEPDKNGQINTLELPFDENELKLNIKLLEAIWIHVKQLSFPNVSAYHATMAGVRQFEQDLIDEKI